METDLGTFRTWLGGKGAVPGDHRQPRKFAVHCEKVLGGDVDPRIATTDHIDLLRIRMKGLADRTIERYIRSWTNFVRAISEGGDGPEGVPYWRSSEFDRDLVSYVLRMREAGTSESHIANAVKFTRHCVKEICLRIGDLRPEQMDSEVVRLLDDELYGEIVDNTRRRYLNALGAFVMFMTGKDPYRELTLPDRTTDVDRYLRSYVRDSPWEEELLLYVGAMQHRGFRDNTMIGKVRSIEACRTRLESAGWVGDPAEITPEALSYLWTFMDDLRESTAKLYLRNLGKFVEFVSGYDPMEDADILWNPDEDMVHRRFIHGEEWRKIRDIAEPDEALVLALGATMGLRRFEMAHLRLDDFTRDAVRVCGKGHGPNGKEVFMPLNSAVRAALAEYLPVRASIIARWGDRSDGRLLVRRTVRQGEYMTPDAVGELVYCLGSKAGVDISSHCLRRFFATSLYSNGTDLNTIRIMMRHTRLDTTLRCYIEADRNLVNQAEDDLIAKLYG